MGMYCYMSCMYNVHTHAHIDMYVACDLAELLEVAPNGKAKALLPLTPNKLQGRTPSCRETQPVTKKIRFLGTFLLLRGTPPALPLYLEVSQWHLKSASW